MASDLILYILGILIFYDFSLHLMELIAGKEQARKIKYYWLEFPNRKRYTLFWTIYWGIALLLILIYIFTL